MDSTADSVAPRWLNMVVTKAVLKPGGLSMSFQFPRYDETVLSNGGPAADLTSKYADEADRNWPACIDLW